MDCYYTLPFRLQTQTNDPNYLKVFCFFPFHTRRGFVVLVFQDTPKASPCKERSDSVADIPIQVKSVTWFMQSGRENREHCSYSHPTFFAGHWSWGPIAYPWTSFYRFVLQSKVIMHAYLYIKGREIGGMISKWNEVVSFFPSGPEQN